MPKTPPSPDWLRLDERSNALDNLEMCDWALAHLPHPIRWKWAIISLHQALYGFTINAVQGTNATSVLEDPCKPDSKLISIWKALDRVKDAAHTWPGTTPLHTTAEECRAVERVGTEFRNGFEHFRPMGWSIEVDGLPDLLLHVLRVTEGVAVGATSHHNWDQSEVVQLREVITRLRGRLTSLSPTRP